MTTNYNLDDDKYVPFMVNGNEYHFYFPTLEQSMQAREIDDSTGKEEQQAMDFMFGLVHLPEGANYPQFKDIAPELNVKQLMNFRKMVETELGSATEVTS